MMQMFTRKSGDSVVNSGGGVLHQRATMCCNSTIMVV